MRSDVRFGISSVARQHIEALVKACDAQCGPGAIPAIAWIDSALNNGILDSQPAIGFYYDRSEIEADIKIVDGLEIVLAIPDDANFRFEGKMLDYGSIGLS